MSESYKHQQLVKRVTDYVITLLPPKDKVFIEVDSPDTKRPSAVIGGFIPDVNYDYKNYRIIGEAKTEQDFDRNHSRDQINAYIQALKAAKEEGKETALVISVPWQSSAQAFNYLKACRKKWDYSDQIYILADNGKEYRV